jgi:hypothetical protein
LKGKLSEDELTKLNVMQQLLEIPKQSMRAAFSSGRTGVSASKQKVPLSKDISLISRY